MTEREPTKLGEVLRTAREAKFIDLARVERDTKIRVRYLAALESGEYRDLPGTVYTRGFLRNYGLYLGLDPDYLVDLYRLEIGGSADRRTMPLPPQPIAARQRRPLVVTSSAVAAVILTLLVVAFAVYLVGEFVTFARTPDLRITDPAADLASFDGAQYLIAGITEPNATITTDGLRENPSAKADAEGGFSVLVGLVPGANVITLVANDPLTGRNSAAVRRTITVVGDASPSPGGPIEISQPAEGETVAGGSVRVAGTAPPHARLSLTAVSVAPPVPSFTVRNLAGQTIAVATASGPTPEPQTIVAAADGTFEAELALAPGSWDLSVAEVGAEPTEAMVLHIVVGPDEGLHGTVTIVGGASYLEVDEDGVPKAGISGRNAQPGDVITLEAVGALRIRVGNAGGVRLTVNGIDLPSMGAAGAVVEWSIVRVP
ncbi:MAG: RodZ domain-containing protein [Chloroflexota bacterium]